MLVPELRNNQRKGESSKKTEAMKGRLGSNRIQLHLEQKLERRENKVPISVLAWVGKTRSLQRKIRPGGWTVISNS